MVEPQLSYSPWTCARSVLESCSICTLVLDPAINSVERITRSFNVRIKEIRQAQKFIKLAQGIDAKVSNKLELRVDVLRKKALALGIAERHSGKGWFLGFGQGVQQISYRIKDTLVASEDYSLLSTVAHTDTWGILSLGSHVEATEPLRPVPSLSPERAMYLITKPIGWVARGLWAYYQLFGWDLDGGKAMLESAYARVGLRYELRLRR